MKKLFKQLWSSPTITSWFSLATKSLRLVILLPLILKRFDAVESAAWLLFSSLLFFGSLVGAQVNLLFSRLIAVAMSGANDLSPIRDANDVRGSGEPNWPMVERVYSTVGLLNALVAILTGITALGMGVYGLEPMLQRYSHPQPVWLAFFLIVGGEVVVQMQQKYTVALRGMNHFALTNRWDVVFSLASTIAGSLALLFGASILQLAIVMQLVLVIGSFRYLLVLRSLEPRFKAFRSFHLDKTILNWAWPPFIRSLTQSFASNGAIKIGSVVYARYGSPGQIASLLLVLRIFDMMWSFSTAAVSSKIPRYSRILAEGRIHSLQEELLKALRLGQWVLISAGLGTIFLLGYLLQLMKSDVKPLPMAMVATLVAGFIIVSTIRHWLVISLIGNHVVAVRSFILSVFASLGLSLLTVEKFGIYAFAISVFAPAIILVNREPLMEGAKILQLSAFQLFRQTALLPWIILSAAILWISLAPIVTRMH